MTDVIAIRLPNPIHQPPPSLTPERQSKFEGRFFVPLPSNEGCIYVRDVRNLWVCIRSVTAMQHDIWEHKVVHYTVLFWVCKRICINKTLKCGKIPLYDS